MVFSSLVGWWVEPTFNCQAGVGRDLELRIEVGGEKGGQPCCER